MRHQPICRNFLPRLLACLCAALASLPGVADTTAAQVNRGTVGIMAGGISGTYLRIASDLANVLDSDDLRVIAIIGKGSLKNIEDLLYLKGIDIAIVQSDVLEFLKRNNTYRNIESKVHYIAKLYNEELHLLANASITRLAELAGKRVNVDGKGSGTALTAAILFDTLGIEVERTHFDQATALNKLGKGEIDALVYVAGKPARLFQDIDAASGLHFVPIEPTAELLETYLPTRLAHADYPDLIAADQRIVTLAVGAVMAVYNWRDGRERHRKVARFVNRFFDNFDTLLEPPWHPKWREVSLPATVPSWTRFPTAAAWLRQRDPAATDNATAAAEAGNR